MAGPGETRRLPPSAPAAAGAYRLVVFSATDAFGTHPLPESGRVTIGRAAEATVRVHDDSISRLHAALHVGDGEAMQLEDLNSANGTKVRGVRVEPGTRVEVLPGDLIELGNLSVVVQRVTVSARPRRLWSHGYLEARLEEECARGGSFALLRVGVDGTADLPAVQAALHAAMGSLDVAASYGPGQYELLLVDAGAERANEIAGTLALGLGRKSIRITTGLACFPRDGRNPEVLIARAETEVRGGTDARSTSAIVLDPAVQELYVAVDRIAAGSISVLLLGETGVGKEVIAEHIHKGSPRRAAPFVRLNCASLSESLLQSELFGYEKGAFTGANTTKTGLIEAAHGGTIFLDEIGELPASMQASLLRVLEERAVLRVGAVKPRPVDIRLICATNRDLESEVSRGTFRGDLYFRINGVSVQIPPLRERPLEIEPLARLFLAEARAREKKGEVPDLAPDVLSRLRTYFWPGNIRELRNMMERASLLCTGPVVGLEHLPMEKMSSTPLVPVARAARMKGADPEEEKRRILETLERCGGNQTRAAEALGISRRTLVYRLSEWGITRPRKPDEPA